MGESGYYPPGAEHDPSAPYNEIDPSQCKDCPECEGKGNFEYSECCIAPIEFGLCTYCREHTEAARCDFCKGSGVVPKTKDDYEDDYLNAMEEKRDASRDP